MAKIEVPEGIHNPPKLPLSWRGSERAQVKRSITLDRRNRVDGFREYLQSINSQYVITDVGVQAVEMAVGWTSVGAHVFYGEHRVDMTIEDMQREFEQEILGLEPLPSGNGLRYWESSAGFSGGAYPIEPFAELIGSDVQSLSDILHDKAAVKFGHVILRNSDYIVPVKRDRYGDKSLVSANYATKLSERGNALVDIALSIADYSTRS